jgi:uncharacterized protein YqgV (UPF0045/DUF77 family)
VCETEEALLILDFQSSLRTNYLYIEGPWPDVCDAIHKCHQAVHTHGAPRIATDIRIGTRIDREIAPGTGNEGKVKRVEEVLDSWKVGVPGSASPRL